MATSDFSTGKTICILAIVVGCFAILWPKVFYPMMQAAFTMTKPRLNDEQVCCDVIYESKIDLKFFAELCKSVIDREMATDPGIRKYRQGKYPPPGMMERCRKKILELCDIDISDALVKNKKGKISIDKRKTSNDSEPDKPQQLNLSQCLEKHFQQGSPLPRRLMKETAALPSHIRQERKSHVGPPIPHPSLMEKGNPFQYKGQDRVATHPGKLSPGGSLRPTLSTGKVGPAGKGGGAMGFVMPIYTVGIIVFFLYTITKVLFRRPEDKTAKVMDFHMDPEYRKYVLSEEYGNSGPLSYTDYLKQKEMQASATAKAKLFGDKGRKQVFTAIEGIIAEMDDFRDRLMAEQSVEKSIDIEDDSFTTSDDETRTRSEMERPVLKKEDSCDDASALELDVVIPDLEDPLKQLDERVSKLEEPLDQLDGRISKLEEPLNQLAEQLKIISVDSKLAVLGIETQAEFQKEPEEPEATEISNIILETSVPSDMQLLVAESQCLTHTSTDRIEGWPDEDQPVVVTGKMTISLLGKEASVHSTESKTSKRPTAPSRLPGSFNEVELRKPISTERQKIEELANALVEDILHKQVPKIFESAAKKAPASPDMDTFEVLSGPRRELNLKSRVSPRRQFSRESVNSQGSSFEYVSACQDEPLTPTAEENPRLSLSPAGSDNVGFEVIKNGNGFHFNGSSPTSFECISAGSGSPYSPEMETTFEKIHSEDGNEAERNTANGERNVESCTNSPSYVNSNLEESFLAISAAENNETHNQDANVPDSELTERDLRPNDVQEPDASSEDIEHVAKKLPDSPNLNVEIVEVAAKSENASPFEEMPSLVEPTSPDFSSDFSFPLRDTSSEQSSAESVVSVTEVCRPGTDQERSAEQVVQEDMESNPQ